jgi:thymidylate synthase
MTDLRYPTLGETWLDLVRRVFHSGEVIGGETREVVCAAAAFEKADFETDPLLRRFASSRHVQEMRKVFFSDEPNQFGHSYASMITGPLGRRDLSDVADLLTSEPDSKRALVSLTGTGNGKVPCLNAIHFLRRSGGLRVVYFARGQDIYRKFYADAVCVHEMGRRVASCLGIPLNLVTGIISSAHIYLADLPEIEAMLAEYEGVPASGTALDGE